MDAERCVVLGLAGRCWTCGEALPTGFPGLDAYCIKSFKIKSNICELTMHLSSTFNIIHKYLIMKPLTSKVDCLSLQFQNILGMILMICKY